MQASVDAAGFVLKTLYTLARDAAETPRFGQRAEASLRGHKFEDIAAKAAYESLVRLGVTPRQPRRNLILPTLSGLQQQFDLVVPDGQRYFIIELKDRSHSQIEQLYAFVAKILDYAFAARDHHTGDQFTGIFVSTAPMLNDHFRQFALAYGIIPVAPDLAPCQVLQESSAVAATRRDAGDLAKRLDVTLPSSRLNEAGA